MAKIRAICVVSVNKRNQKEPKLSIILILNSILLYLCFSIISTLEGNYYM